MQTINITKNLHYTWKNKNIPKKYIKNINSWKKQLPDWNFTFWDDKSIDILLKNEKIKFKSKIEKIDYAKYYIMYNFGGLYIDIDVELYLNIEELLISNCIFFKEKFNNDIDLYGPFLLYANKKETLYKELLQYIKAIKKIDNIKNIKNRTIEVLYNTGPLMLNNFLKNKKITGYDVNTFSKYGKHYHDGNWFNKKPLLNILHKTG
jgi:mannosyltransferase OCH1-like enzyme